MDYTLNLPQEIGTTSGVQSDGVLLGSVSHTVLSSDQLSYYTYAHEVTWGVKYNVNAPISSGFTWIPIQDELNASTPVSPFAPLNVAQPNNDLYLAVRDGVTGFTFDVSTAGTTGGSITFAAFYNGPSGYAPLTSATFSINFMMATGGATVSFTPPTDWQTDFNGYPEAGAQRWLKIVVTGTFTGQPAVTGGWEITADLEEAGAGTSNPPFFNPYKDLLPETGDTLYVSSPYKPYGLIVGYTTPLPTGNVTYTYSKADGTFAPLTVISDTSSGFTAENEQTWDELTVTSTGTGASAWSTEGIPANGYVSAVVAGLPTSFGNRFGIGLATVQTGPLAFSLGVTPFYKIFINGVAVFTSTLTPAVNDVIEVLRYNGNVYFLVNGVNINPDDTYPDTTGIRYMGVTAQDNAVDIPITFADWSTRKATPIDMTLTGTVNFSEATAPRTDNLPAYYYIQFNPPADFASLSALLSKTGEAGYNLGIVTASGATSNIELLTEQLLTVDSPDNVYLHTGEQTTIQNMSLILGEPNNYVNENTFLLILKNTVNTTTQEVTMPVPTVPSPIINESFTKHGMTDIIIAQVDGDETLTIGEPSYFTIST